MSNRSALYDQISAMQPGERRRFAINVVRERIPDIDSESALEALNAVCTVTRERECLALVNLALHPFKGDGHYRKAALAGIIALIQDEARFIEVSDNA
jgi:hypothetical protein